MLKAGIVGLPNVGKSSLFNALTAQAVATENYPFCTVEPNIGMVEVADPRLDAVFRRTRSPRRVAAVVQFVDIAGLVRGASEGEGLGNRFLGHIREVDAVVHVLRCFRDPDVTHVLGGVDPVRDREIVNTELLIADLESVERRLDRLERRVRSGDAEAGREVALLERVRNGLAEGTPARHVEVSPAEVALLRTFHLLTSKPVLYVANVDEQSLPDGDDEWTGEVGEVLRKAEPDAGFVCVSSDVEAELARLATSERDEFLEMLGLAEPGAHRVTRATYDVLGVITFFTTNEKESRAWTIPRGTRAPEAGGTIHSDFLRGFIRAETIGYDDFARVGSLRAARDQGLIRSEGKEYVVRDGDLILFRFNV